MVSRRVRARFEISDSNPDLHKCAYFIKKLYLDSRGGGGGWLVGIFFLFYFIIFDVLKFSHILNINLQGRVMS
jgi:hypothetical protein